MSRIENWKFNWRIGMAYPLTGAGFEFQSRMMFEKFAPEFLEKFGKEFNTHNILFAMLATHGFPCLIAFLTMIGICLLSCRSMRRSVRGRAEFRWLANYCHLVEVSMLAFIVNGMFVNMEYFDLPYHLVAVTASLRVIHQRMVAEEATVRPEEPELRVVPAV